jgi:hypothetical protein
MKKKLLTILFACLLLAVFAPDASGQGLVEDRTKLGRTAMQFLTVSIDPRAASMADAMTAQEASSVAQFYNPAGMARMETTFHASFGITQWFSDIQYNQASVAYRPVEGKYGTFGVSVIAVDYGNFLRTIRSGNDQGYEDLGTFNPTAQSFGFGYAISPTEQFSFGANVKYARQLLGESIIGQEEGSGLVRENNDVGTLAFDFGVLYRTGFRSLNFAVGIRNFSQEVSYTDASQNTFELPLTFRIGFSMDTMEFVGVELNREMHKVNLSVDAVKPRAFKEQVRMGGEYVFMETLALRAGYSVPNNEERGINLGAGIQQKLGDIGLGADYAYTQFGVLGDVHRVALQISF